jgi:hypothetical protein
LTVHVEEFLGTDFVDGQVMPGSARLISIAADGTVREGARVPLEPCCSRYEWVVGPDGVAYSTTLVQIELPPLDGGGDGPISMTSELRAHGPGGIPAGFPVTIDGDASPPAFDAAGRIHLAVARAGDLSARTLIFDSAGRKVGGSGNLGIIARDTCSGIEGSCIKPAAPLVGPDGTTFVVSAFVGDMTVAGVDPAGRSLTGWPYQSDGPDQARRTCAAGACDSFDLAMPTLGPDMVLHLLQGSRTGSVGGSIVAVGPDGAVRPGWPVELRRPGAGFWSVVVGSDRMAHALAVEPESSDASSATILSIDPDGTVRAATTVMEP